MKVSVISKSESLDHLNEKLSENYILMLSRYIMDNKKEFTIRNIEDMNLSDFLKEFNKYQDIEHECDTVFLLVEPS